MLFQFNPVRIGDLLVSKKIIDEKQLLEALSLQSETKQRIGKILIEKKMVEETQLAKIIAEQANLDFLDLETFNIDFEYARNVISELSARKFKYLILRKDVLLHICMVEPTDIFAHDEIKKIITEGQNFKVYVITESDFKNFVGKIFRKTKEMSGLVDELQKEVKTRQTEVYEEDVLDDNNVASKLLKNILEEAVAEGASDIHIEPQTDSLIVRFRQDGLLVNKIHQSKTIMQPLMQRLKVIANLDISEKRIPQDGKFRLNISARDIDFRVATAPTPNGETAVLRILNQSSKLVKLANLGMEKELQDKLLSVLSHQFGTVIVTGPTGSGKTTSLYALLNEVNADTNKVITIEDPIEFQFNKITQIQVNEKIDLSFVKVLRSVLRQDPDIILVGEIRDTETVETALKAAITGHMVLATLHTNDAISTPMRLIDMGVPGYVVGMALNHVLAQRLVRLNCHHCIEEEKITDLQKKWILKYKPELENTKFYKSKGCEMCGYRGVTGRRGIFELLEMTTELKHAISKNELLEFQVLAEKQLKGNSMVDSAINLLIDKKISLEEVIKFSSWI